MSGLELLLPYRGGPVYIIADVHANLPALQVVLDSIPTTADIVCAGDLLGYYTEPNEVCQLLRERQVHCIKGNHDKYVLGELSYSDSRESKYRIQDTRESLTQQNLEWLSSLPDTIELRFTGDENGTPVGASLYIAHGSPQNAEEYIYKDTQIGFVWPDATDYLVLGHTHHPMRRPAEKGIIVNPGSVGQARDRTPGACYASIDPLSGTVEFFRAAYDIDAYKNKLRDVGIQEAMIEILTRTA
jgi:predicted phosphodiesterase